jgi:hypothetical protein
LVFLSFVFAEKHDSVGQLLKTQENQRITLMRKEQRVGGNLLKNPQMVDISI